jgi:UDP-N-acetylglucosamine--N-acetylmuramyl-(pentapeptide) pyrophosphoryl-undecaprenol N-acetylglucosamine transferase
LRTLLVMGGSQGASGINQSMIKSLPALQGEPLQVIHLSGARDERLAADNYQRENIPRTSRRFITRWRKSTARLISRSHARCSESLGAGGVRAPVAADSFPVRGDDHQTRNAEIFTRAEAALMVREADLSGDLLARKIRELIDDPNTLQRMSENAGRLAPKNAAGLVVDTMERYTARNDARA